MPTAKKTNDGVIDVPQTDIGEVETGIVGITPFIHNRLAEKARHELLYPKGRKNAAERAASVKHDPVEEFRASPYKLHEDDSPTLLATLGACFKQAMMTAALDLPGVNKSQIGRLIWVEGHYVPLWGSVKLHMGVVRSADMARTPDIRTRAISPQWATILTVRFVKPLINPKTVLNLLHTGGNSAGVGDWRPQKGSDTFGQFKLVNLDDPKLLEIQKLDRAVQLLALDEAKPYDAEAVELLEWFTSEREERGQ